MKFTINKDKLLNGINTVIKAVPSSTTYEYLKYIKIYVSEGIIKLTANNLDFAIETIIEGNSKENGEICVDANFINRVLRTLPDNELIVETIEGEKLQITYDNVKNASSHINYFSTYNFPEFPSYERENPIVLSQYTLKNLIDTTIFSISNNENNKIMTGELFDIKNNVLKVVSLDGHRISIRKEQLKDEYEDTKVIIPGKILLEISKIISGDIDKDVLIYINKNNIIFEFDNNIVFSRLIEGEYFNVEHMIYNDYSTKVTVNKNDLINGIGRTDPFIKEGERKAVIFDYGDDILKLSAASSDGSNEDYVDIVKEGPDIRIGFNGKYILDVARVIDEEEINIYLVNSKTPCFIKDEKDKYFYLVLPVNI